VRFAAVATLLSLVSHIIVIALAGGCIYRSFLVLARVKTLQF
jgi:hypothetical protein